LSKGRVVVAMSGGVDSSVTALLLHEEGYEVIGVTMRLYTVPDPSAFPLHRSCCSIEDVQDARRVCHRIGVPHYVLNMEREFQQYVIRAFVEEYRRGRTPYPCLACNDRLKFGFLLERARLLEAEFVATGHYARIVKGKDGKYHLLKGVDPHKDQSFVLFGLTQEQMAHILLPLGWFTKEEVRALARRAGLPVADKPDSQEICFVLEGDYRRFLARHLPDRPGEIVDTAGRVLGTHRGVHHYTIGQRRGLGVAVGRPLYVVALDPERNRVVVGTEEDLKAEGLWAHPFHWLAGQPPEGPVEGSVRIRYRAPEVPARVLPLPDGGAEVRFREPQRAVTPGQPVVLYRGEEVVGGGTIEQALGPLPRPEPALAGEPAPGGG